jgi:tetratricopeptide (TPR) repeat protein
VAQALSSAARKLQTRPARLRLATLATRLVAGENVFEKVLDMLTKCISKIDKEEAADVTKKDWCEAEQTSATDNKGDKESNLGSLKGTISSLQTGINSTLDSQQDATESLATNRIDQAEQTDQRAKEHALYLEDVANLEEAEKILGKAIEVLTKYYDYLEAMNAPHHYDKKSGKDVMGGNLKRMADASQAELEEACSADPGCSGFTSLGWLKGPLPPEDEWFGAASDLYVKVFDRTAGHAALLQKARARDEPGTWGDGVESEGQRDKGAEVLDMLRFILSETTTEKQTADTDEGNSQRDYDSDMADLKEDEEDLVESLETLALTLANQKKSLEEAEEDKSKTAKDLAMIIKYLQDIEPGCTFIQENYETRKQARIDEKTALEGAIDELKATPAFAAGGEEE